MRNPLDSITVTGEFKEVAQPGTGLPDASGVRRHIGVDLRASIGTNVYAPGNGVVTMSYGDGKALTVIEARINGKLWRFLHLSKRNVSAGQSISEGQVIGLSGNSGGVAAHLHVDVRNDGTTWNASLNNYMDFRQVIAAANAPAQASNHLYKVGDTVWLHPAQNSWRVYPVGAKPVIGNEKAFLRPNNYRNGPNGQIGLTYQIIGISQYANAYTIRTQMFGDSDIYLDNEASKV